MANERPTFEPVPCFNHISGTKCLNAAEGWIPMISCQADFPPEIFETAMSQLIHHPEYNSTLILRSEVVADMVDPEGLPDMPRLPGRKLARCIHRRLLPRRPGRDAALEQYCSLYGPSHEDEAVTVDTVILTPLVESGSSLPYYHPAVSHLAFRYIPSDQSTLRIEVIPLDGTPTDLDSRLYRTSLALLETLHRYGWGAMTNYKKRVNHDCLINREVYQDLYLIMRERHKHLIHTWQEVTDPLKHVFEDIGIATFLMLLWKETFSSHDTQPPSESGEPWRSWPRPPSGFLDLGCGNGLLSHILTAEGYEGYGIDLRSRISWEHYPEASRSRLKVHAFDPTQYSIDPSTSSVILSPVDEEYFKPGTFIIGNHADELTPWIPLLATLHKASGYISIPCCSWAFDCKFERGMMQGDLYRIPIPSTSSSTDEGDETNFVDSLNLGGGPGSATSSYSVYRVWLASLSLYCGWEIETETLRIPSTRNWALIGRKQVQERDPGEALSNVKSILNIVETRAVFKTRKPEGRAGDH